jgi:TRAP-type C4-dicarboxylate transport system permease small subunit
LPSDAVGAGSIGTLPLQAGKRKSTLTAAIGNGIIRTISALLALQLIGMTLVMCSLVVTRYLFSYSPSWSEEATRFLMVWLVMLGAAVLTFYEDHIALYVLPARLNARGRLYHRLMVNIVTVFVTAVVGYYGWKFAFGIAHGISPGTQMSMLVPTLAIPIGLTLMGAAALANVLRLAVLIRTSRDYTLVDQSEVMDGVFKPATD